MDGSNRGIWLKVILITVFIIIGALFIAYLMGGFVAVTETFKWVATTVIALSLLILAIGFVFWLITKRKIDMLEHRREQIIDACLQAQTMIKQELWFKGDNNIGTRKIGDVIGYAEAYTAPEEMRIIDKKTKKEMLKRVTEPQPIYFIAFKKSNMPFAKKEIFVGTLDDIYGKKEGFAGERIFVNGCNFAPKIYDQYMLAHHWHDTTFVDKTVNMDVQRYGLSEWTREFKDIGDSMINLDSGFIKTKELSRMEELPVVGDGGQ